VKKELVTIKINDQEVAAPQSWTILKAAGRAGIRIPTLCYCPEFEPPAVCRICSVEIKGRGVVPACAYYVAEGLEVLTDSPLIQQLRKVNLGLLYAHGHFGQCGTCPKRENCQLLNLVLEYQAVQIGLETKKPPLSLKKEFDLVFDPSKCIKCRLCVAVCQKYGSGVIQVQGWGENLKIIPPQKGCIGCRQCAWYCPVGAIYLKNEGHDEV